MNLELKKPLIVFDLETTGVDVTKDRIVEISLVKVLLNGEREVKTRRINPEMSIPLEASLVHGIYDKDVADCPTFKMVAKSLFAYLEGCDFAGFNCNKFDVPLLAEEFLRVGLVLNMAKHKVIDVQNIYHKMEPRTLVAAYKFYCGKDLTDAHSAEADTLATLDVLLSQVDKYDELEKNVDFLSEFTTRAKTADLAGRIVFNEQNQEVFAFGKHKDKSVAEVLKKEPSYYDWLMKGDFPQYTKQIITEIYLRNAASKK